MFLKAHLELRGSALLCIVAVLSISRLLYNRYCNGLNKIPGPFLASLTNYWRLSLVWGRRPELTHIELHEKYGELVRIGPNTLIVANWNAVKKIYALNAGYVKPQVGLLSRPDEHSEGKASLQFIQHPRREIPLQAPPGSRERLFDSTIDAFIAQLESRVVNRPGEDGVLDFGLWLQLYAFDVIGELTFSKPLGFVDEGRDIDGIIGTLERMLDYFAVVGQNPWLDRLFLKNPVLLWLSDHGIIDTTSPVVTFARARMAARLTEKSTLVDEEKVSSAARPRRDFLDRFLEANKKDPEFIPDQRVLALTVANIFAGSDTTAITLRAVFYFLLKHPRVLRKLLAELQSADLGPVTQNVSWESTRNLPYLGAVIQESLRCHPAVGLPLERIVPAHGLNVGGIFIPPGTIVGATAWAVHAKEEIFGSDPGKYRPERWIEVSESKRIEMNNALFSFGMGARTCIGKNISLLEMYKLVPTLLRRYEITFAREKSDWTLHNAWFVKQSDFFVRINSRREVTLGDGQ